MTQAPRITLCMIVRDEEQALAACLDANAPWVDEIVVVDTGSADGTVDVARRAGARVLTIDWPDDFARARNHGLAAAGGDWILVLDADEQLDAEAGADLRRLAADPALLCLSFRRCDYDGDRLLSRVSVVRAWRRRDDIRYRYRVHEQVLPDILRVSEREGSGRGVCGGRLIHTGAAPGVVAERGKLERNRHLGELQLAETPDDPYVLFKLAETLLLQHGRGPRVRELLARAVAALAALPDEELRALAFGGQAAALLADDLLRDGETERAWEVADFGLARCAETADLLSIHGNCALARGDGAAAAASFAACRALAKRVGVLAAASEVTGVGALVGLARAFALQGQADQAAAAAAAAVALDPASETALRCWAEMEAGAGRGRAAFVRLGEIATDRPDWAPVWAVGGEMLAQAGAYVDALVWLDRAAALGRGEVGRGVDGLHAARGRCLLALGRIESAAEAFEAGLPAPACIAGLIAVHLLLHADPAAALDPADDDLAAAARRVLDVVRGTPGHPLQARLDDAVAWLAAARFPNAAFLRRLL
ncbi:MAG TPA: glycosyltransferase family 2 protein [Candidatus Krumholzibacteria bacterium]|nr:glycosyltransferase family 2 protein [Candidatus Krumholzibacteria bacterium]HRX49798.1 glycosyltransferase family 2 protein [Candidatus Krumholzibacteria bacterium]